jgi:hypothetical protein
MDEIIYIWVFYLKPKTASNNNFAKHLNQAYKPAYIDLNLKRNCKVMAINFNLLEDAQ